MTKTTLIILTSFFLFSCGTGLSVRKSQVRYFDKSFAATVDNNAFKTHGRRYGIPTLLSLFEIQDVLTNNVSVKFNDSGELLLTYMDNETIKEKIFKGLFSKKGYYEVLLRNESKEIPPFFPIIYARYNINRIRIALTIQGDLIIDNEWNESGHILILGAGDSGRRQSFFKVSTLK